MNRVSRLSMLAFAACATLASCGGTNNGATGEELCLLFDAATQERMDQSMAIVLPGSALAETTAADDACVQRFTSGESWVEVRLIDGDNYDGDELLEMNDTLATDGIDTSRAKLATGDVVAIATSSNPAGISTWDASLAAVAALARE